MKSNREKDPATFDPAGASTSIRDVAAYLQGVADALAALSQPPMLGLKPHGVAGVAESVSPEAPVETSSASARGTVPYGGLEPAADTMPMSQTSLDDLERFASDSMFDDDAWETPFVEERRSDVRLRLAPLSPEWYALLDARAG
jgi:hypothetical protein